MCRKVRLPVPSPRGVQSFQPEHLLLYLLYRLVVMQCSCAIGLVVAVEYGHALEVQGIHPSNSWGPPRVFNRKTSTGNFYLFYLFIFYVWVLGYIADYVCTQDLTLLWCWETICMLRTKPGHPYTRQIFYFLFAPTPKF